MKKRNGKKRWVKGTIEGREGRMRRGRSRSERRNEGVNERVNEGLIMDECGLKDGAKSG